MIRIKFYLFKEQARVFKRYYKNWRFALVDSSLHLLYLFSNPYRICRKFLERRGAEVVYAYGETPLTTLEGIVSAFGIGADDRWLELGSGRGRGCFWLSQFIGCQVRGVEWIPTFVSRAAWIVRGLFLNRVEFKNICMQEADFSWPTVVFLCGTCMSDEEIESIPMELLPLGAKLISISEPLNKPCFTLVKTLEVSYPWGKTEAYLQIKNDLAAKSSTPLQSMNLWNTAKPFFRQSDGRPAR